MQICNLTWAHTTHTQFLLGKNVWVQTTNENVFLGRQGKNALFSSQFSNISHTIYIKLNMPILRANYVKVSRLSKLAMFRNVYNQNETLYNPRALTYIVQIRFGGFH